MDLTTHRGHPAFVRSLGLCTLTLCVSCSRSASGLVAVYVINTLLAVAATFRAKERGQPALLWAAKTFSVGGLAFDQLSQLPTLEEVERAKARKGKRALKTTTKKGGRSR